MKPSLTHIHLPGLTPYLRANALQSHFVSAYLAYKAQHPPPSPSSREAPPSPPNPTLITFSTTPTYTLGRRHLNALTPSQIHTLTHYKNHVASFHETLRGGQTTFHGPGQVVAYLIAGLREHGLDTRGFIELLEGATIDVLKKWRLKGKTKEPQPGIWVNQRGEGKEGQKEKRKIASVGVHLRRHVSSHGVGINVCTDLGWFERIEACGLPGSVMTSFLVKEVQMKGDEWKGARAIAGGDIGGEAQDIVEGLMERVAGQFAGAVAGRLKGVEGWVEKGEVDEAWFTESETAAGAEE